MDPLQELHKQVAAELLRRIKSGEASAQDLGVAARFLKDNGIQSIPEANPAMLEIAEQMPFKLSGEDDLAATG